MKEYGANIEIKRVALLQGDVSATPELCFDVDAKRLAAVEKHGDRVGKRGIDNNKAWFLERYQNRACMELDAMNSNELRNRVERAIQGYIDWPAWQRMKEIEQVEKTSTVEIMKSLKRQSAGYSQASPRIEARPPQNNRNGGHVLYTCPNAACEVSIWSAPDAWLICGDCLARLTE